MSDRVVAVVGATGAVGRTMRAILESRDFALGSLRLLASERSAGSVIETRWGEVEVEDLTLADPSGVDIALFSAGGDRSRAHAPRFADAGAVVIDNSSAFRMDPSVPLIVAGVNDAAVGAHRGIIANPNCTTMTLMMAAGPLHRAAGLRSMVATSYQSVSGSGQQGVVELIEQTDLLRPDLDALMTGGWADPRPSLYTRPIGFNVLPLAGSVTDQGYTDEEWKLVERVEEDPRPPRPPRGADLCPCARARGPWCCCLTPLRAADRARRGDRDPGDSAGRPGLDRRGANPARLGRDRRRAGGSDPPDCGSPGWHQPLGGR